VEENKTLSLSMSRHQEQPVVFLESNRDLDLDGTQRFTDTASQNPEKHTVTTWKLGLTEPLETAQQPCKQQTNSWWPDFAIP
jgi:hypothetical protein